MISHPLGQPILFDLHGWYMLVHDRKRNEVLFRKCGPPVRGGLDGDDAEQIPQGKPPPIPLDFRPPISQQ